MSKADLPPRSTRRTRGIRRWPCLLLVGTMIAGLASSALANSGTSTVQAYTTGTKITPNSPIGGARYGRVIRLQYSGTANGTLLATFEAWPNDFGIYKSTDDGLTWALIATTTETHFSGWQFKVEPDLFETPVQMGNLPAGTVLLAGNSVNGNGHQMEVYYSLDHGVTWGYRGLVDENSATLKGLWEPRLDVTSGGQLVCYYSDERSSPTYNQLIGERVSPDGGLTWGAETSACAIADGVQRPGMAVTTRLPNGQHVMSFEAQPGNTGQVHIKFSSDGINWGSGPADYGTAVATASGAYIGSCPYIAWIPAGGANGTLVLNAQYLLNSSNTDRELLINTNLGAGNWTMIPAPVQWQGGGNSLAGWSQGMIPTWDGQGLIQLASSQVTVNGDVNWNEMRFGREQMILPGKTYTVTNQNSGLAADVPGNTTVRGTGLQQAAVTGGADELWTFNDQGNNVWTVTNPGNTLAWDNYNFSTAVGGIIDQWDYSGNAAQQFKLRPVGNGGWQFLNVYSGMAISVTAASLNSGAAMVQANSATALEQNWLPLQTGSLPTAIYALDGGTLDSSGNGNAGTASASATTYVASRIGARALQFNGTDANIQIPRSVGSGTCFTIAFWMKTTSAGGTGSDWYNGAGLVDGDVAGETNDFGVSLLNGKVAFGVGNPHLTLQSTVAVNDGKWHHVAATRNGFDGTLSIYLDGVFNAKVIGPIGPRMSPPALRLGSLQTAVAGLFYNGTLDEVRLYNTWLDAATIASLAAAPTPNSTLVAEYDLEGNATDSSIYSHTGTTFGTVTYVAGKVDAQAAQFDGTSGYITVPASVTDDFSIAYWIKTTATGGTSTQWYQGAGLVDGDIPGNAADFGTSLLGGKVAFGMGTTDGTTPTTIKSASAVNDGAWHYVTVTRNRASGLMKIYVDGALQASATGATGTRVSPTLRIGAIRSGGGFFAGALDDAQLYNYELNASQVAALFAPQPLPASWTSADLGNPGGTGSAIYNAASGVWSLGGGGADIGLTSDQFQFASETFGGDGSAVACLYPGAIMTDGTVNPNAKAGIMFRDSLAANAPFVALVHTQGQGVQLLYRDSTGTAAGQQGATVAVSPGVYLRLVRSNNTFTAYYATAAGTRPPADSWVLIGSHTTSMAGPARVGLAACAHDNVRLANAGYTDVSVSPPTPPTISSVPNQLIGQNTSTPVLSVTITDALVTGDNLVLSASSANPSLVPNANIALGGSGSSRTLQVTPSPYQSGSTIITLTANNNQPSANTAASTFVVTVQTTAVGSWRQQYFGTTANSGAAADNATPDNDGITNLLKYALVIPPGHSGVGSLPTSRIVQSADGQHLALAFTRDPLRNDVTMQVQASDSVAGPWSVLATSVDGAVFSGNGSVSETGVGNGLIHVEVSDTATVSSSSRRFLRLTATDP